MGQNILYYSSNVRTELNTGVHVTRETKEQTELRVKREIDGVRVKLKLQTQYSLPSLDSHLQSFYNILIEEYNLCNTIDFLNAEI